MENFQNKIQAAKKVASQNSQTDQDSRRERWKKPSYHDYDSERSTRSDRSGDYERRRDKYEGSRDRPSHRDERAHHSDKMEEGRDSTRDRAGAERREYLSKCLASVSSSSTSKFKNMFQRPSEDDVPFTSGFKPQKNKPAFIKPETDKPQPSWKKREESQKEDKKQTREAEDENKPTTKPRVSPDKEKIQRHKAPSPG